MSIPFNLTFGVENDVQNAVWGARSSSLLCEKSHPHEGFVTNGDTTNTNPTRVGSFSHLKQRQGDVRLPEEIVRPNQVSREDQYSYAVPALALHCPRRHL